MRARPLLAASLLLLSAFPIVPFPAAQAQAIPSLAMGFSPNYLLPLTRGSPIYSPGDEMWVASGYNTTATVSLALPNGTSAGPPASLGPQSLEQVYRFPGSSPIGTWRLSVTAPGSVRNATFSVRSGAESVKPSLGSSSLGGSILFQNFTLPATGAYDIQACPLGLSRTAEVPGIVLPGGAGGVMNVSLGEGAVEANVSGVAEPFSMWGELYAPYSYETGGGIVTSGLLVARTDEAVVAGSQATRLKLPFVGGLPMREGRYTLRDFIRTQSGLSVEEYQYLLTRGAGWLSMASCSSLTAVSTGSFRTSSDLASPVSMWPRTLLLMYGSGGLEGYTETPLPPAGAAVDLRLGLANASLTGVGTSVSGDQIQGWGVSAGTVYVVAKGFPTQVTIGLDFGVASETSSVTIPQAYWRGNATFKVGSIDAYATQGGRPLPNATFTVSSGGRGAGFTAGRAGRISAFLPPGNYTVTAKSQGAASTQVASVSSGRVTSIHLDVEAPGFPFVLVAEAAMGAVGVVLGGVVWRRYFRQRSLYD